VIALLTAIGAVVIQLQPELERNYRQWLMTGVLALALLLTLLWFLLLSGFRWRTRLIVLALLAIIGFAAPQLLRVDGTRDGTGLPRLAWRWSAPHSNTFARASTRSAAPVPATAARNPQLLDVPQFFGPERTGIVNGLALSPEWSTTPPKELWRQPIGSGWSAFAVADGRAYTQEQRGEEELVTCYDALTGALIWSHANRTRFFEWQGGEGPRATPTVLEGRVFAQGATGVLDCLVAATGQRIWSRNTLAEHQLPNLTWGVSCSPLVFDDKVIVTGGQAAGPTVLAYSRATGEPLWKAGTDKASYASPTLATVAGRRVILSANAASLTIHEPESGKVLLDYRWSDDKWPKAAQPAVLDGDRVFLSAGYGQGCVMLHITAVADGSLAATQLWKNLRMKTQFNSVGVRDGFIYGLDDGLLACVDAATGERKWKGGRYGSGQTLLAGDLVLVQAERGPIAVAEAKPDAFQEVARLEALSSKTWNHPTLAGRYLLLRNDQEAVCYELPLRAQPAMAESGSSQVAR
jgi:outer membrane protein assembly factor BamB